MLVLILQDSRIDCFANIVKVSCIDCTITWCYEDLPVFRFLLCIGPQARHHGLSEFHCASHSFLLAVLSFSVLVLPVLVRFFCFQVLPHVSKGAARFAVAFSMFSLKAGIFALITTPWWSTPLFLVLTFSIAITTVMICLFSLSARRLRYRQILHLIIAIWPGMQKHANDCKTCVIPMPVL